MLHELYLQCLQELSYTKGFIFPLFSLIFLIVLNVNIIPEQLKCALFSQFTFIHPAPFCPVSNRSSGRLGAPNTFRSPRPPVFRPAVWIFHKQRGP